MYNVVCVNRNCRLWKFCTPSEDRSECYTSNCECYASNRKCYADTRAEGGSKCHDSAPADHTEEVNEPAVRYCACN